MHEGTPVSATNTVLYDWSTRYAKIKRRSLYITITSLTHPGERFEAADRYLGTGFVYLGTGFVKYV